MAGEVCHVRCRVCVAEGVTRCCRGVSREVLVPGRCHGSRVHDGVEVCLARCHARCRVGVAEGVTRCCRGVSREVSGVCGGGVSREASGCAQVSGA